MNAEFMQEVEAKFSVELEMLTADPTFSQLSPLQKLQRAYDRLDVGLLENDLPSKPTTSDIANMIDASARFGAIAAIMFQLAKIATYSGSKSPDPVVHNLEQPQQEEASRIWSKARKPRKMVRKVRV